MTPAQRHRIACEAIAAGSSDTDITQLTAYQALQKQYYQDKTILKNLAGIQDKTAYKAQILPNYQDWIAGVIDSGEASPDDSITPAVLIWQIDCGQLDTAMPLAQFALDKKLESGDEYQRNLPTIIIEEYAEKISQGADIAAENLQTLIGWATAKQDGRHIHNIPDPVRAKLLKAAAEKTEDEDPQQAAALYEQALGYNEKAGCKKQLEALRKNIQAA